MLIRILLAALPAARRRRLAGALGAAHLLVTPVRKQSEFWELLMRENYDIVIARLDQLPEPHQGSIRTIRELPDQPEVIVIVDQEDPVQRAELMSSGAQAVVYEGLGETVLSETLNSLIDRRRVLAGNQLDPGDRRHRFDFSDFASGSPAMQRLMAMTARVAPTNSSLLVLGETGVGKEWLARAVHAASARARGPFMAVNCSALPEALLESELFGHEQGAFTGAVRARRGYFELAHGGTLFLDEIGELPSHLQVKLLRVLQDHIIQRVGSETSFKVDVRVMAATNCDLAADVEAKRFRSDLYYRIGVVSLTVPPLRERAEDIPTLVSSYIDHYRLRLGVKTNGIAPAAMQALVEYSWPGNVRELKNVIERAMLLCTEAEIDLGDLPEIIAGSARRDGQAAAAPGVFGRESASNGAPVTLESLYGEPLLEATRTLVAEFEKEYLTKVLLRAGGRVGDAAHLAGIDPRSLHSKMKRYGLSRGDFKIGRAS